MPLLPAARVMEPMHPRDRDQILLSTALPVPRAQLMWKRVVCRVSGGGSGAARAAAPDHGSGSTATIADGHGVLGEVVIDPGVAGLQVDVAEHTTGHDAAVEPAVDRPHRVGGRGIPGRGG